MEEGEGSRKSGRSESDLSGEGTFKKPRQEMEYLTTGRGRSSMPCTKYFSIAGCRFGERCHFSHDAVYGYNASAPDASAVPNFAEKKTLLCYKFSHGGCVESEKCPYAHGQGELRGLITYFKNPNVTGPMPTSSLADCLKPQTRFGATAKSSASITTTRTSTKGMDSQLYARMSGTEISFEEDESDHSLLNIKIKGTLNKVKLAIQLVQDHIAPPNSHARHE